MRFGIAYSFRNGCGALLLLIGSFAADCSIPRLGESFLWSILPQSLVEQLDRWIKPVRLGMRFGIAYGLRNGCGECHIPSLRESFIGLIPPQGFIKQPEGWIELVRLDVRFSSLQGPRYDFGPLFLF